jgi:hypothetical protein
MDGLGLSILFLFILLVSVFAALARRKNARPAIFREIDALLSLPNTVGQAVETGRRLHISLGSGTIGDTHTASALAGLTVLDQISAVATVSDKPPVVTTADGTAMLLAQDTLKNVYARQNVLSRYDPTSAQVAGLSPLSFGAALTSLVKDESVGGTVLIGSMGAEAALLAEADQRANITTLAGADDPATQAVLFASADSPLIGEDIFAGGAYIGRNPGHVGSLRAQDVIRILIIIGIVLAALARTFGLPL